MAISISNLKMRASLEEIGQLISYQMSNKLSQMYRALQGIYQNNHGEIKVLEESLNYIDQERSLCRVIFQSIGGQFIPVLELRTPTSTRRYSQIDEVAANLTPNMRAALYKFEDPKNFLYKHVELEVERIISTPKHPFNDKNNASNPQAISKAISRHKRKLEKRLKNN